MTYWNRRTYCLITGASRGIGKEIAIQISNKVAPGSVIVIVARSKESLEKTKEEIKNGSPQVHVFVVSMDLKRPNNGEFLKMLKDSMTEFASKPGDFEHAMIVHNADSIPGKERVTRKLDNAEFMASYYTFNVISPVLLTTQFLKVFTKAITPVRTIVQITSMCSIVPFPYMPLYAMNKSARNRVFECMAQEELIEATLNNTSTHNLRILNYSPGVVDTEALRNFSNNEGNDIQLLDIMYSLTYANGVPVTCEESVKKFLHILKEDKYYSGQYIDYDNHQKFVKYVNSVCDFLGVDMEATLCSKL